MAVFRRRRVFRDYGDTQFVGSASVISGALLTAAVVFAGSAIGATSSSATLGDASGSIIFGGGSISSANMEISGSGTLVFAGSAAGIGISSGSASASVVFGGTARPSADATGAIIFGGGATVGSTFTMDASAAIAFAGTVAGYQLGVPNSPSIVFAGSLGTPVLTDGTIEAVAVDAPIVFDGTAVGTSANIVQGAIAFSGSATGDRVGTTLPIDKIYISVKPVYEIYITAKVHGT